MPPFVTVLCREATPVVTDVPMQHQAAANRLIETTISIVTSAIDIYETGSTAVKMSGRDYHNEIAGQVMDLFFIAELVTALNASAAGSIIVQTVDYVSDSTDPIDAGYKTDFVMMVNCLGGDA